MSKMEDLKDRAAGDGNGVRRVPPGFEAAAVKPGSAPIKQRTYEQLDGAEGRQVFFRPQRYLRADLGQVRATLRLTPAHGEPHDCEIIDISQNGVAFEWPRGVPVELGSVVPVLSVSFDEHEAYRGAARVGSVRESDGKIIAGASFIDSLMNVDDVLQLRDVKAHRGDARGLGLLQRPWRVAGHERFKSLVAEMSLFLADASHKLAELEASLPWNVVHGEQGSPARDELVNLVHVDFVAEFVRLSEEIDAALRTATAAERQPLKEFSRALLQQYLVQAPCWQRALRKPLGYPGDFEVMKFMYEDQFAGPTLFAKAVSLAGLWTRPGIAVRARKDLIRQRLSALIDAHAATGTPVKILSIAAGPAQEIFELLQERQAIPVPVQIVLFDQDRGALTYAYSRLKPLIDQRWAGTVSIVYLQDSIKRLLRDATIFRSFGAFDAIFACGLFDYLELPTAVTLAKNLHQNLLPGGMLYLGNMVPTQPNRWFMELHLDWTLIYRTHAEMLELARAAAPGVPSEIVEEPTGINPFVAIHHS